MTQAPISSAGLDEETARAELYGLLAALYYAPPTEELMAQLRVAVTEAPAAGGFLEEPWRALVGAAREIDDASIAAEYITLFGGVGKPEVYLFGSFYLSGFLNEKPLAALRADIAELGLARDDAMSETEDHFAYLCEVMRYLIAGDDVAVGRVFQFHAERTDLLCRLNEGATDVMVTDDAKFKWHTELLGKTQGGGDAGVRNGHHHINITGRFQRQLTAHLFAHVIDRAATEDGVGAGEIDVLEDAGPCRLAREGPVALDALIRDDDDFAILDFAHEARADDVEGAGL